MLSFDPLQNEMVRPETSKCSRSSSRASYFNATTANFYSKHGSDATPNEDKLNGGSNHLTNANGNQKGFKSKAMMSATLYDGKLKQKNTEESNRTINKPGLGKFDVKDGKRLMSASQGFKILKSDLKQGLSLDKIFGGEFKKVDVSTNNLKEFEKPRARPQKPASGRRSQNQNVDLFENSYEMGRNAADEKGYGFDNEDKINVQQGYNVSSHDDQGTDENYGKETSTYFNMVKNTSGKGHENNGADKFFRDDTRTNGREQETRSYSVNANKKAQDEAIIDKYQGSFYGKFNGTKADQEDNHNRQTFYKNNNENSNQFRISSTGFKKTFYQQGKRDEESAGGKQSDRQAFGYEYYDRDKNYGTPSVLSHDPVKMRDTATKFYSDKNDHQGYMQKGTNEINFIERIEKHEQNMLNKYANKRTSDYDEAQSRKHYENEIDKLRKISTPIREFHRESSFVSKNFSK